MMHLLKAFAIYSSTIGEQHFKISLLIQSSPQRFLFLVGVFEEHARLLQWLVFFICSTQTGYFLFICSTSST